jgi:pimeloyl-ACP methyl ester carboxylesterase
MAAAFLALTGVVWAEEIAETQLPGQGASESATRRQSHGVRSDDRLSAALGAAKTAWPGMIEGNKRDAETYNAALAEVVAALQERRFADRETAGSFRLTLEREGAGRLDPARANLVTLAANVRLRDLEPRATEEGAGVPLVFYFDQSSPFLKNQPGISRFGISVPITAFLSFDSNEARLSFYNRLERDQVEIGDRKLALAADFSAQIALMVSRSPNRPFDIPGLVFTRQHLRHAGLYQLQLYDRERIPVILVHGLFSRPEAWVQVLNGLMADERIRSRYQFWVFLYPTGLPIWHSSMLLRSELDRFHGELEKQGRHENLHRIVLVGHSMGGLVSSLVVRNPGRSFWAALSDTPLEELDLSPEARRMVTDMVKFTPRTDIARVIYVTTPHRGSPIPHNPIIDRAIRFIQMPRTFSRQDRKVLVEAIREDLRGLFTLPANSIRFLRSGSPVLEAIETLPLTDTIPYHSIIGDRGKGDSPNSTDGVVPYWSSHLKTAVTEKIVPSDHSAPQNPETAKEIRRILLETYR